MTLPQCLKTRESPRHEDNLVLSARPMSVTCVSTTTQAKAGLDWATRWCVYSGRPFPLSTFSVVLKFFRTCEVVQVQSRSTGANVMNVRLDYESGQTYTQYFSNFHIKVSGGGEKRVKISFRENGDSRAYASLSLPKEKAAQLSHAILAASVGVDQPIEFSFEEPKPRVVAA
jgi:hypothetical protein